MTDTQGYILIEDSRKAVDSSFCWGFTAGIMFAALLSFCAAIVALKM